MFRGPIQDLLKSFMNDHDGQKLFDIKSLYRDVARAFVDKAIQRKDVLMDILASEVKAFLARVDLAEELRKTLQGMSVNLNAEFGFGKNDKTKVKIKKNPRASRRSKKGKKSPTVSKKA